MQIVDAVNNPKYMSRENIEKYMAASRKINVADAFRTNDLSFIPGGFEVSITLNNGQTLVYDKIKSPKKYIQSLSNYENIVSVTVDGKPFNF
jgi:hypothetical protein